MPPSRHPALAASAPRRPLLSGVSLRDAMSCLGTLRSRFADERQKAQVCRRLLAHVGLEAVWTERGPATSGRVFASSELSTRQTSVLLAAWAIWNGSGMLTLAEVLDLDAETLGLVAALLAAIAQGSEAIEAWIHSAEAGTPPGGATAR